MSAQIDASGSAFEAFMDWNYFTGALVGFSIVLLYTIFGGFIAVAWSDLLQGVLMFLGLVSLPIIALQFHDIHLKFTWGDGAFNYDNNYGIKLTGTESHDNIIDSNSFDDSFVGVHIYNAAHDTYL